MNHSTKAPTAFVSWAHNDAAWDRTIYDFVLRLRSPGGVRADVDFFHRHKVGHDWNTYAHARIASSDFVLVAVSAAYRKKWEEDAAENEGRDSGAALEARVIRDGNLPKTLAVLLPGAAVQDIPSQLKERMWFTVPTIDRAGLDDVLRCLHRQAEFVPNTVSGGPAFMSNSRKEHFDSSDVAAVPLLSPAIVEAAAPSGEDDPTFEARTILRAAVLDARSVEESPVTDYLYAELDHSIGAYAAANRSIAFGLDALPRSPTGYQGALSQVMTVATNLNDDLSKKRYAIPEGDGRHRHPRPPQDLLTLGQAQRIVDFYAVASEALTVRRPTEHQRVIFGAIMLGLDREHHADRLRRRFVLRERVARNVFSKELADGESASVSSAASFADADVVDGKRGEVAADVLACLAQAHLCLHDVEYRRSLPVGDLLKRSREEIEADRRLLKRSVALNTFTYAISGTMPWIFAATEADRSDIQGRENESPHSLKQAPATLWPARQAALLSLYRRAHGHRLLGDHQRAYNDLRKLQRNAHLARDQVHRLRDDTHRDADCDLDFRRISAFLETLDALAEYRIGELYRADHDYMQALVYLCRSHERVEHQNGLGWSASDRALLEVILRIGKGKAFFEIGALKRSLQWYVNAWIAMLDLLPKSSIEPESKSSVESLRAYLHDRKHEAEIDKPGLITELEAASKAMVAVVRRIPPSQKTLAADILQRISHVVMMLRLSTKEPIAKRLLDAALKLDARSLLVHTSLLRWEVRQGVTPRSPVDPMDLWTTGASDVDQAIRAGEHVMLERLGERRYNDPKATAHVQVARSLGEHFTTHTDSINLRGAVQHLYLTRSRAERPPRRAEPPQGQPFLEFVCLRRFGCFTPFMPRPAAVSAVGGGYLVRAIWPSPSDSDGEPKVFNVLVDPGEGVVNNLYSVGLGIADVDMVVATHDHPDHITALDALLSLRHEHKKMPVTSGERPPLPPMYIVGNESVYLRYRFLDPKKLEEDGCLDPKEIDGKDEAKYMVRRVSEVVGVDLAAGLGVGRLLIAPLETNHRDLGRHPAAGFVLELNLPPNAGHARRQMQIAFMSDTGLAAVGDTEPTAPTEVRVKSKAWDRALQSDIVVAHVSDVPSGEIRSLSGLNAVDHSTSATTHFDKCVTALAKERPEECERLMHALSIVAGSDEDEPAAPRPLLEPASLDRITDRDDPPEHLYLHGLLAVADLLNRKHKSDTRDPLPRVLVIGEFREQLGSFRGTIAREINKSVFATKAGCRAVALTADIGLRIRLGNESSRNRVLCSTCSLNNERFDFERFHSPENIGEVCVKGDHEAMYWNCPVHIPRDRDSFVEQMGGYDPFAAGGRYHG